MRSLSLLLCVFAVFQVHAQRVISEAEAVDLSLKNSPDIKASQLQVEQNQKLQSGAVNIPNPELMAESPTGDFYTLGIQQSLDFPGVYVQQNRLQKERAQLAKQEVQLTESEIRYRVRTTYLSVQYAKAVVALLHKQDSVYAAIDSAAARRYKAGEIDIIERTSAQMQYGLVHTQYLQSLADLQTAETQLQLYTGLDEPVTAVPLPEYAGARNNFPLVPDTAALRAGMRLQYFAQLEMISKRSLRLERQRMLPGMTFGYLNQGPANTPLFYRFRGGITIPLWFWQYTGSIRAAKIGVQIAHQQYLGQQQMLTSALLDAQNELYKTQNALIYYSSSALPQSNTIITASQRYFNEGAVEYSSHLRTMGDAYQVQRQYLDALRDYYAAVIRINYLNGN